MSNQGLSPYDQSKKCVKSSNFVELKCVSIGSANEINGVLDRMSGATFNRISIVDSTVQDDFPYEKLNKITWDSLVLGNPQVVTFKKNGFCSPEIKMVKPF